MKRLILASGSERRNYLLSWLGVPFEVEVSDFDEGSVKEEDPQNLVKKLASAKAKEVANKIKTKQVLVIGADTVVKINDWVVGKPKNENDAVRILSRLSGKTHEVFTGIAVISVEHNSNNKAIVGAERTEVTFRNLTQQEIKDYVATREPLDKGGAYAIQMGAKGFVEKVEGSYTNVVGLPLLLLCNFLEKQGYRIEKDVKKIIFEKTGYWS